MFQSPSFTHRLHHRLRTTASCLWLHVAPHSTLRVNEGAVTGLSYPSTPGFPRCQRFQVSPPRPAAVASASEAILCGRRYALSIRPAGRPCPTFTITRSPSHFLLGAVSRSPNFARNVCRAIRLIGSKRRVSLPSALRSRTSPIRGMRLQRLLVTELACSCHCRAGTPAAFRPCVLQFGDLPECSCNSKTT